MSIVYCQICTLPPEYCEFNRKKFSQCKRWLQGSHPQMFQELYGEAKQAEEPAAPPQATQEVQNEPEPEEVEDDGSDTADEFQGDSDNAEPTADDAPPPPPRPDNDDSDTTPPPANSQPSSNKKRKRKRRRKRGAPAQEAEQLAENSSPSSSPQKQRRSQQQPAPQPSSRRQAAVEVSDDDDSDSDREHESKSRDERQVRFQEPDEQPRRASGRSGRAPKPAKYIGVASVTRRGNKKLTVVRGLMDFGMKPKKAQSAFRKKFASGVGVNTVNGKQEIVVQGEVRYDMMQFLHQKWRVPPKILFYEARDGTLTAGYTPEGMCMPPP